MDELEIQTITSAGWGENAYIVHQPGNDHALVVDPGDGAAVAAALEANGLTLDAILLTHAHLDHITGAALLVRTTGAPVYLNPAARGLYDRAAEQAALFGVDIEPPPPPDVALEPGPLALAGIDFDVRPAPGHAPGHVILYVPAAGVAFVGDVVFQNSIGRTDLPGGDSRRLMQSIRDEVLTLPDDTTLYPGHGPPTTVGRERIGNPFLAPLYGGSDFA